jgi:hypothetical protein
VIYLQVVETVDDLVDLVQYKVVVGVHLMLDHTFFMGLMIIRVHDVPGVFFELVFSERLHIEETLKKEIVLTCSTNHELSIF